MSAHAAREPAHLTHGPFLGHATPGSATVWARASAPGPYTLVVAARKGEPERGIAAIAAADSDLTLRWTIDGLEPASGYAFEVRRGDDVLAGDWTLATVEGDDAPRASIALGSCADERRFPEQPVWRRMVESGAEAIVLLGDTPYIDSTELDVQRRRYRELYAVPDVAAALAARPFYATWDDHDFGRNDTNGTLPGKEFPRQAFLEYHANPSAGDGEAGIYTSFRRGPVEVFLLDARWFAATEPSPADDTKATLLGRAQYDWLREGLSASDAPFKLLASGMIWNGATRPFKIDHWETYAHERDAIFSFVGQERISGVVLVGGDIHRSRALRYPLEAVVGYPLTELITSPIANLVIEQANAPHPGLLWDGGVTQTFLLLEADVSGRAATLSARFLDHEGAELFALELDADELVRRD